MKLDYFHDQFLGLDNQKIDKIKLKSLKKQRNSIFSQQKSNRLDKIIEMLAEFEAPKENINYIKEQFYKNNDIRII